MKGAFGLGLSVLPVSGLVLLVPPVYLLAGWIRVFNALGSHEERVAAFESTLPGALREPTASTLFQAACAVAAAAVSATAVLRLRGLPRWLSLGTLGAGMLLSLWNVWTLL